MSLNEEQIREALKQVIDPELFVNIIDLGLVYTVTVAPAQSNGNITPASGSDITTPGHQAQDNQTPSAPTAPQNAEEAPKEDVFIEMTMTSPACPAGPQLIGNAKQVVGRLPGVSNVEVKIVMTPPWTPDLMTEEARDQLGIF
jgi:metal-sulfur cluster biosynthetic enzyme